MDNLITKTWDCVARGNDFDFYADPDLVAEEPEVVAEVAAFAKTHNFREVLDVLKGDFGDYAPCFHLERDFNRTIGSGALSSKKGQR